MDVPVAMLNSPLQHRFFSSSTAVLLNAASVDAGSGFSITTVSLEKPMPSMKMSCIGSPPR
ncbi:hypothetical protein D3C83_207120 [compost metagenome]